MLTPAHPGTSMPRHASRLCPRKSGNRLADAEHVAFAVAKPGGHLPGSLAGIVAGHLGDAVDGLQPRQVNLLENNSAPAQFGYRGDNIVDRESHLSERAGRGTGRLEQREL